MDEICLVNCYAWELKSSYLRSCHFIISAEVWLKEEGDLFGFRVDTVLLINIDALDLNLSIPFLSAPHVILLLYKI